MKYILFSIFIYSNAVFASDTISCVLELSDNFEIPVEYFSVEILFVENSTQCLYNPSYADKYDQLALFKSKIKELGGPSYIYEEMVSIDLLSQYPNALLINIKNISPEDYKLIREASKFSFAEKLNIYYWLDQKYLLKAHGSIKKLLEMGEDKMQIIKKLSQQENHILHEIAIDFEETDYILWDLDIEEENRFSNLIKLETNGFETHQMRTSFSCKLEYLLY